MLTDRFKVLNHTHSLIFVVPQVELPQIFARKVRTIVMVPPRTLSQPELGVVFMAFPGQCKTSTAPVLFP